jgi:hypothetical protein
MYFSTGELVFNSNFKNKYPDRRSGLNATEVISYQYLGMTKIAGALNMLPKIILRHNIINPRLSSDFIKNFVLLFNKLNLSVGYALTIFSSLSYASGK